MQKLRNALLALFIAIALTWMPSFTVASAQAQQAPDRHPGLQFAIQCESPKCDFDNETGKFVEFQSGDIKPGHPVHIFYDSQRLLNAPNPKPCSDFETLEVTGHVMNHEPNVSFENLDCLKGEECENIVDYVKVGDFEAPECDPSEELQIWFTGNDDECIDDNNGELYTFPVICE
ncbi:hypothetical protein [Moorena sp. SIO3H5]|uniref:hypothetical protein n=1 Tax=Moorena sp. SIO3H5 TaxID=2607834 RepID=UPI0013B920D8|nr:hypothetical protein [Moorena sp. SIO3H5]NEO70867.1 hypothetical protein [Moorena sp. SIO3H5]